MSINDDFKTFLHDIEPSETTVNQISAAHRSLRNYLSSHEDYADVYIDSFLSGSYAKHTAIRPAKDDDNRDVDIDVETRHGIDVDAKAVLEELRDALLENSKYSTAKVQSHSVGIQMSGLDIDVVPLAKVEDSCYIGDYETGMWNLTNPKGHLHWSTDFNQAHFEKFKPVVKILKWWRREHCPEGKRWPKGITLEKMIADNFPEEDMPYDELVMSVLQTMSDAYEDDLDKDRVPCIEDPALAGNDLAASYKVDDFKTFLAEVNGSIELLDADGSTNVSWRQILGNRFPAGTSRGANSLTSIIYMSKSEALAVKWRAARPWIFAPSKPNMRIAAEVTLPSGSSHYVHSDGEVIPKYSSIVYHAVRSQKLSSYDVRWQIVNTGDEAIAANCRRGEITDSNYINGSRRETTAYAGRHYVQCFIVRNGVCVAYSNEFFINVAQE